MLYVSFLLFLLGDNDPLDAVEIGSATGEVGQIKQVKVLGTWGIEVGASGVLCAQHTYLLAVELRCWAALCRRSAW